MNNKSIKLIKLERGLAIKSQINILYELLINRKNNISNISMPTYKEHVKFVKNHPYRAWYLIQADEIYVGSAYIMQSNCIGIHLLNTSIFPDVLNRITKYHKPLKEIKSVRPPHFYINISPENKKIEYQLKKIGAIKIQSTFSLKSI